MPLDAYDFSPRYTWIADRFGGIDKSKAKDAGYEVLDGEAWIEQEAYFSEGLPACSI